MHTEGVKSTFNRRQIWNKRAPLRPFYNACMRIIGALLLRMRCIDLHRVPADGPVILMINHVSWADPFLVLIAVRRSISALAKVESFEDRRTGWMLGPYGGIPVHRGAVDLQAIRAATEVLKEGGVVLISPEGTRSKTGGLIPAQEGLAFLATRTGAPVVPIALVGGPDVLPSLKRLRRASVTLTVGEPFHLQPAAGKADRAALQQLTDFAMRRLAALLPPHMRGVYGEAPAIPESSR
jgi:1-acyl-sn-glycerol-3-phosphate acyltransferase